MKITTVIDSLSGGGAERTLFTLAVAFQAAGHSVTMITFKGEQAHASTLGGCSHISLRSTALSSNRFIKAFRIATSLRKAILSSEPDLIISFMDQANILSLLTTFDKKIAVFVCERIYPAHSSLMTISSNQIVKKFFSLLRNGIYRKATKIILQSERMIDYFPSYLHEKMIVIPNPITAPSSDGELPQIETDSIVSIGRLVEQKRFDILIGAFAAIAAEFPDWHLQIVGQGISLNG
jgi:glycosyltransferase involved in cell wall biosynthesis